MGAFRKRIAERLAWLELDVDGEPVNKFTPSVRKELRNLLESVCADDEVDAAILISRKPDHFIAGVDVEEFARLWTRAEALALVREGQELINRFETIGKPIVAAIHGACVGGGLEASLACKYRIATNHPKTNFRLPEVQIGINPAAGGCQRLPRLIGLRNSLDMILTGRSVPATVAHRKGLVDELVHHSVLDAVAKKVAQRLATGWRPNRSRSGLSRFVIEQNRLAHKAILSRARKAVIEKTQGHYPAPLAAIEAVGHGLQYGVEAGLENEAAHFTELAIGEVSKQLVQVFFATTALKKDSDLAQGEKPPRPVKNLAVVGAGFMGSAIAGIAAARAAVDVRVRDSHLDRVATGLEGARDVLRDRLRKGHIDEYEHRRLDALISGGVDWAGFGRADLVVEAVSEDPDAKQQVIAEAETVVPPDCVIASNTSTISIARLAEIAERPERVVGMHFFSPVAKMQLIEVVAHERTAPWAIAMSASFGRELGKKVIILRDSPGFFVNRVLTPYLREAWVLMDEGVDVWAIDSAMTEFGFPAGPITLLDEIGLDVAYKSSRVLSETFGDRMRPTDGLARMVAEGRLGRKTGRGLYLYRRGNRRQVDYGEQNGAGGPAVEPTPPADIANRLVYSMLNEVVRAFGEEVVQLPRVADMGAIYGFGFPPFRGGPLRYIDCLGPARVLAILDELKERYGDRFEPAECLVEMAERNDTFYEQPIATEN